MDLQQRLYSERHWHESEDKARDANSLIVGLYASGVFAEAEAYHLQALGEVADAQVLDYGCGAGGTATLLRARGAQVTGFDISHTRLAQAHQRLATVNGQQPVGLVQCAAELLPFPDHAFDAVLGKQILHHLELDAAIPEIARVLQPGGRAVFLEPLIHNPLLEGYRRLTPHLRSPSERALSMADLERIGSYFRRWQHREFVLLSVLPALVQALTRSGPLLERLRLALQRFDHRLLRAAPVLRRYCWQTVIVLEA